MTDDRGRAGSVVSVDTGSIRKQHRFDLAETSQSSGSRLLVDESELERDIHLTLELVSRASSDPGEPRELTRGVPPTPFRDVRNQRDGSSTHPGSEPESLITGESSRDSVHLDRECLRALPNVKSPVILHRQGIRHGRLPGNTLACVRIEPCHLSSVICHLRRKGETQS